MGISRSKIEGYMLPVKKGKYYDRAAVDSLLSQIAADADDTVLELAGMRDRISELEKREESVAQALVIVKQLSEQIISKAKTEAEKIIMESTAKKLEMEQEVNRLDTIRLSLKSALERELDELVEKFKSEVRVSSIDLDTETQE